MKNWLKKKMRRWLFPEYDEVVIFMEEVRVAMEQKVDAKTIKLDRPLALLGNMTNCRVNVSLKASPKIVLAELGLEALLGVSGKKHVVTSCYFTGKGDRIMLKEESK